MNNLKLNGEKLQDRLILENIEVGTMVTDLRKKIEKELIKKEKGTPPQQIFINYSNKKINIKKKPKKKMNWRDSKPKYI